MNSKHSLSKNLLMLTAVLTRSVLGLTHAAYAAPNAASTRPPAKQATSTSPTPRPVMTASVTMPQFNRRVAVLPELAALQAGNLVTIRDDGSVTNSIWQGTYMFQPAGSKVLPGRMYAR